ncbi:MAG: DegT/DnrJ/EryC1/StrS family aminotransferase [Chloroflexi bacterium]|nr:DegT/DnrJ/EryC1/StrS family aminotransferase [Chloroflexota bacterium]
MIPFGELKSQYAAIKSEIDEAIQTVLEGGWFVLGENVERLEMEFADYCGAKYAVGVGSGTEALHLALLACGVQPGDEVITVPNTAVPTASAISFAGAIPSLADIDPASCNMDPNWLESAITSKTRAIVPVHLYGQAADMGPILDIARRRNISVVEDAAQAHGTEYRGRRVGALGDAGCFSFYPSKNLGGYGDGGMVVTDDEEVARKVQLLRNYGQKVRYYHSIKGFNSRLDEMQAAILRVKLRYLDGWNEARRERAALYDRLLADTSVRTPTELGYGRHVYHLYAIRSQRRDELQRYLEASGVGTVIHYPVPIHLQEAYRDLGYSAGAYPVAERHAREVLSLPMYPELPLESVERVAEVIRGFEGGIGRTD